MTTDNTELLPCPMCGCNVKITQTNGMGADYTLKKFSVIKCHHRCYVKVMKPSKSQAIKAWNTRAQTKREHELEAIIKKALPYVEHTDGAGIGDEILERVIKQTLNKHKEEEDDLDN